MFTFLDHLIDECCTFLPITHDTSDTFWMEVGVVVIREHWKDRDTSLTHQAQRLLVKPIFHLVGLRIDKEPLRQHHIQVSYIVLQRDVSVLIPVNIPCRAHTNPWVVPLPKVFLRQTVRLSYKTLLLYGSFRIVIMHLLLLEEVTKRLIECCRLVVLGIRR